MKNIKIPILTILLMTAIIFQGCQKSEVNIPKDNEDNININHELGDVEVAKSPKKVLVFDYGILDILDNLEVEVLGLPKSNIPSMLSKYENEKYQNIGSLFEPDFEKINDLKPDVIFISGRAVESYEELNKIAPTVYLTIDNNDYLASLERNAKVIGEIFEKEEESEKKLLEIKEKSLALEKEVKEKDNNALIIMANSGELSVYGENSRFGIIHKGLGFKESDENIDDSTHGQNITFEYILEKNPDYIFVIDRGKVVGGEISAKDMFENEIIKNSKAYKNQNIIYLDPEIWYITSGGFSGTLKMIEEVSSSIN